MMYAIRILTPLLVLLFPTHHLTSAKEPGPAVSVFDVKKERVVRVIPLTSRLEAAFIHTLRQSPAPYGGIDMNPSNGWVIHVPFSSPVNIPDSLYPGPIREMYLFIETGTKPKALLFFTATKHVMVVVLEEEPDPYIRGLRLTIA